MTKYQQLDENEFLKNEIKAFVQQEVLKAAREICRTVAEDVAQEVVTERLSYLISKEVAIYNASKLEGLVLGYLKREGAVPHLNNAKDLKSIEIFIDDHTSDDGDIDDEILGSPTEEVYELYCEMCEDQKLRPVHKKAFSREINRKYGVKTVPKSINGKSVRIYTR